MKKQVSGTVPYEWYENCANGNIGIFHRLRKSEGMDKLCPHLY